MSKALILAEIPLDVLAEMANAAGENVESCVRKTVEAADQAGRFLLEAKSRISHGEWSSWLKTNWLWSARSAQQYMSISESKAQNAALLESASSIREALAIIAEERNPKRIEVVAVTPADTAPTDDENAGASDETAGASSIKQEPRRAEVQPERSPAPPSPPAKKEKRMPAVDTLALLADDRDTILAMWPNYATDKDRELFASMVMVTIKELRSGATS